MTVPIYEQRMAEMQIDRGALAEGFPDAAGVSQYLDRGFDQNASRRKAKPPPITDDLSHLVHMTLSQKLANHGTSLEKIAKLSGKSVGVVKWALRKRHAYPKAINAIAPFVSESLRKELGWRG